MIEKPMEQYKSVEKLELKEIQKEFKKVHCPSCEEEVGSDNINLQNSVAKCSSCNVVFSIEEELESVKNNNQIKQETIRPEGIDLFYYKDDLEIAVQQHIHGIDAFGVIIFPLLSFFSLLIYFLKEIPAIVPIVLTTGAVYFIYKAFNYSNNKTYLDINHNSLTKKSRPKNLKKDRTFDAGDIDQLYLKNANDGYPHYSIYMIINGLEGQKHEKLLTVNTLSKAKYLEQEIERHLNIQNRKVSGEIEI